jgi:hypothetical protein
VTPGGALGSREARRARAEDGPDRRRRQWRGGVARWRGGEGSTGQLYKHASPVTAGDAGRASPCHGGSGSARTADAADGPEVRRVHGAVRRCGRR